MVHEAQGRVDSNSPTSYTLDLAVPAFCIVSTVALPEGDDYLSYDLLELSLDLLYPL
jgi:hypothetical protein